VAAGRTISLNTSSTPTATATATIARNAAATKRRHAARLGELRLKGGEDEQPCAKP
jgi:hypothetical protein